MLGDFAVDGFFLVSGYLVLQSLSQSSNGVEYMGKRVLRIYPGYAVACLGTLFLGAAAGGRFPALTFETIFIGFARVLFLGLVDMDHAFAGNRVQGLNGSLWSIPYEFHCYILLLVLASLGLVRRRWLMVALVVSLMIWSILAGSSPHTSLETLIGLASVNARTFTLFGAGCLFYMFRDRVQPSNSLLVLSAVALPVTMLFTHFVTAGMAVFGGYLLFTYALHERPSSLSGVTERIDLSYGIYLYGWPVTSFLIWYFHGSINRWFLIVASLLITAGLASLSWTLVEKPALALKAVLSREPRPRVTKSASNLGQERETNPVINL
jgi:peptidoglycan/LPS O-acetylase OafA/YrhL